MPNITTNYSAFGAWERKNNPLKFLFRKVSRPLVEPNTDGRVLCPRAVWCDDNGYRLYFMEHGACCPPGVMGVVVSAVSKDGENWIRDPGVRLGPVCPRSAKRVLAPDIVRLPDGSGRMYAEGRSDGGSSVIISARSVDGIEWVPEAGLRLVDSRGKISYGTPNCVKLPGAGWRMYCHAVCDETRHIISAYSDDGTHWSVESGVRIPQTKPEESYSAYSPFVGFTDHDDWYMLYAAWGTQRNMGGRILAARSNDGIEWEKCASPVLVPGNRYDARHCSEPCLLNLVDGSWRLFYEACDTNGVWRILSARSGGPNPK